MWYSGEKQIVGHSKSKEGQVKQVQSEVKRKNGGKWEGRDKKMGRTCKEDEKAERREIQRVGQIQRVGKRTKSRKCKEGTT